MKKKKPEFLYFECMASKFSLYYGERMCESFESVCKTERRIWVGFWGCFYAHKSPRRNGLFTFLYVLCDTLYSSFKIILPISKSVIWLPVLYKSIIRDYSYWKADFNHVVTFWARRNDFEQSIYNSNGRNQIKKNTSQLMDYNTLFCKALIKCMIFIQTIMCYHHPLARYLHKNVNKTFRRGDLWA